MSDDLDLDEGVRLSDRVPHVCYKADGSANLGHNWLVADFGADDYDERFNAPNPKTGQRQTVIVTTDNAHGSQMTSSAGRDADLVAWLLTNREELLRLAAIGQAHETTTTTAATAAGTETAP